MDIYLFILRLIHIVAGVFWAGGLFTLAMFILPSINTTMPEGAKVMQRMMAGYRFPVHMLNAAGLTVFSGILMYAKLSLGFKLQWIVSPHGICLTIGGLAAIIAFLLGIFINKPRADRIGRIGKEIMQAGGLPTESQVAEMTNLRLAMTQMTRYMAFLVMIAVIGMAIAKYI
jgi:uncharacterized membrane protein